MHLQGRVRAEVVFLSKSHLDEEKANDLRRKLSFDLAYVVRSDGRSGGLVPFCNNANNVVLNYKSDNFIDVLFLDDGGVDWRLTGFYGCPPWDQCHFSWQYIRYMCVLPTRG